MGTTYKPTQVPAHLRQVVLPHQSFYGTYVGIFHFRSGKIPYVTLSRLSVLAQLWILCAESLHHKVISYIERVTERLLVSYLRQ